MLQLENMPVRKAASSTDGHACVELCPGDWFRDKLDGQVLPQQLERELLKPGSMVVLDSKHLDKVNPAERTGLQVYTAKEVRRFLDRAQGGYDELVAGEAGSAPFAVPASELDPAALPEHYAEDTELLRGAGSVALLGDGLKFEGYSPLVFNKNEVRAFLGACAWSQFHDLALLRPTEMAAYAA